MQIREMNADDLRRNMLRTFFTLRAGLVVLSFLLPLGLLVYSFLKHGYLQAGSISEFYGHEEGAMRDFFVGILCAVGLLLILYKGYSRLEDWLLNFAGLFAVATAMVPCNCWPGSEKNSWHGVFALLFFGCVGAVCLFCASQTVEMLPTEEQRKWYTRAYKSIGIWLFVAPLGAYAIARFSGQRNRALFVVEFAAIAVFAIYWAIKSREIKITSAERKAIYGALENVDGKVVSRPPDVEQWQRMAV
jgi:hypothetical protein